MGAIALEKGGNTQLCVVALEETAQDLRGLSPRDISFPGWNLTFPKSPSQRADNNANYRAIPPPRIYLELETVACSPTSMKDGVYISRIVASHKRLHAIIGDGPVEILQLAQPGICRSNPRAPAGW